MCFERERGVKVDSDFKAYFYYEKEKIRAIASQRKGMKNKFLKICNTNSIFYAYRSKKERKYDIRERGGVPRVNLYSKTKSL